MKVLALKLSVQQILGLIKFFAKVEQEIKKKNRSFKIYQFLILKFI